MKVKELIEKLQEFNPELEAWWHDTIEGNDSPVESVWVSESHEITYNDGKENKVVKKGVIISPRSEF